jgi:hypothetical protein
MTSALDSRESDVIRSEHGIASNVRKAAERQPARVLQMITGRVSLSLPVSVARRLEAEAF